MNGHKGALIIHNFPYAQSLKIGGEISFAFVPSCPLWFNRLLLRSSVASAVNMTFIIRCRRCPDLSFVRFIRMHTEHVPVNLDSNHLVACQPFSHMGKAF